jgi:subtilisin family serine protease
LPRAAAGGLTIALTLALAATAPGSAAVVPGPATAAAAPTASAAPSGSATPHDRLAASRTDARLADAPVVRTHHLTLVTGDRVVHTVDAEGRQAVTARLGTGSGDRNHESGTFHSVERDGDVYVFPVEVIPYLGTLLDEELFNVTALVEQGYATGRPADRVTPVIVSYRADAERDLPPGVARTTTLSSIGAIAGEVTDRRAAAFGRALDSQLRIDADAIDSGRPRLFARSGPLEGVRTVYLDGKVEASLADSVPQIGAPEAWDAGFTGEGVDVAVLDTGIDGDHPDVSGKVVAQQNFTTDPTATDLNGHGTHVAATVAGTGDGSGGQRPGVAPDAMLLNGKVLDRNGSGQFSWIIDGMEWAANSGADVISMSLQGGSSDGTDPLSLAVDQLTVDHGVLFTIASGNFGPGRQSVTLPGTADLALTVGAVDKSDVLAGFSGRGPRPGDYAIKPDVTAPGVDIVAARAAGTSLGQPIDDLYTMLSGTSMATPHVAGAAAIMLEEFPDWTPQQVKAALVRVKAAFMPLCAA